MRYLSIHFYFLFVYVGFYSSIAQLYEEPVNVESFSESAIFPLLSSLKKYQILTPNQFEHADHSRRKREIKTEIQDAAGVNFQDVYFTFNYDGKEYILDLSINQELLPRSFTTSSYSKLGRLQMHKPTKKDRNNCYYQGHVRNIDNSQVFMSTCNGLSGSIFLPDDILLIEPLKNNKGQVIDNKHVVYRMDDTKTKHNVSCGNNNDTDYALAFANDLRKMAVMESIYGKQIRHKRQTNEEKKFVELLVVVDNAMAKKFANRIELDGHVKNLVNHLDGFYQKLGIRVILSHIEVWNDTDLVELSIDPQEVLDAFLTYRKDRLANSSADSPWRYTDNAQLLYGRDFNGSAIGMGSVGTMCTSLSAGVNQDHGKGSSNVVYAAATMAHEMGHNFGMLHDTDDCVCPEDAQCIMASRIGPEPGNDWSSCSEKYLEDNRKFGGQTCLVNVPEPDTIYTEPVCGNDIVETGEQCDCGPPEQCQSRCCNATSCMLLPGAICDTGTCCDDCRYTTAGTECRGTNNNTCELPEYCSGNSSNCPGDMYAEDGTPCFEGTAACYEGVCLTHDMQCQITWGEGSSSGVDKCYTLVNKLGNDNGNCGLDGAGNFIKCTPENAKCGKLQCQGGNTKPLISTAQKAYRNTITSGDVQTKCKTIGSLNSADVIDLGVVRQGTMCDIGKVCDSGECKALERLECTEKCNNHGVCNNHGHCHCDCGWSLPYCAVKGDGGGGSADSGPACVNYTIPNDSEKSTVATSTAESYSTVGNDGTTSATVSSHHADVQTILLTILMSVFFSLLTGGERFVCYEGDRYVQRMKASREQRLKEVRRNKRNARKQVTATNDMNNSQENLFEEEHPNITYLPTNQKKYDLWEDDSIPTWNGTAPSNPPSTKPAPPKSCPPLRRPLTAPARPPAVKQSNTILLQPPSWGQGQNQPKRPPPPPASKPPAQNGPAQVAPPPPVVVNKNPKFPPIPPNKPATASKPQVPVCPAPQPYSGYSFDNNSNQPTEPENLSVMERAKRFNAI
ncbi:zinc metalloproteinase-disintegrin-like MTP8 isoform X1 [Clavelina lepadiformis]|uniref:zinc metalloproteinase-disintegrin-like MTP8 isoform X1 n=1 Tax=Clavelina lepadiformis TaxID=159417 RepID=UPI00404151FE